MVKLFLEAKYKGSDGHDEIIYDDRLEVHT